MIEAALAGQATYHEDLPLLMNCKGYDEPTWFTFSYSPVRDESGAVAGMFCACTETTGKILAQQRQEAEKERLDREVSATQRATEGLRTANEALKKNTVELAYSEARYRSALMAGRLVHWETDFTTGTRIWSRDAMALFGISLPDGRGRFGGSDDEFRAAVHPDDRHVVPTFYQLADKQDWFPVEYRIQRPDGSIRWVSGGAQVIARGPDGKALMVNVATDITDRKIGEEHVHSLLAEITHRGKNLLAVIQAIASQTGRSTVSFEEFQERFTRRLHGLAASHDLLVMQNWKGASLANLVRKQLAPFAEWDSGAIQTLGTGYLSKSQDYRDPGHGAARIGDQRGQARFAIGTGGNNRHFLANRKHNRSDAGTAENGLGRTRWPAGHAAVA